MLLASSNWTKKYSIGSPGNPFILGSKCQGSRSRGTKTVQAWVFALLWVLASSRWLFDDSFSCFDIIPMFDGSTNKQPPVHSKGCTALCICECVFFLFFVSQLSIFNCVLLLVYYHLWWIKLIICIGALWFLLICTLEIFLLKKYKPADAGNVFLWLVTLNFNLLVAK